MTYIHKHSALLLKLAWLLSLLGLAGSLFFSEIMSLPPCVLCWYQRIALYPLVILLAIGITKHDSAVRRYTLPLAIAGLALSSYHLGVYYRIIPEAITPCTQGVSCSTRQIEWFGFVSIPLLSWVAFVAITFCLYVQPTSQETPRV